MMAQPDKFAESVPLTATAAEISGFLYAGFSTVCFLLAESGVPTEHLGRNALISIVCHVMMVAAHDPELYEWLRYQLLADAPIDSQRLQVQSMANGLRRIREATGAAS